MPHLIERLLPMQVPGELVRVLYGKARAQTRQAALDWTDGFAVLDSAWPAMLGVLELWVDHQMSMWMR